MLWKSIQVKKRDIEQRNGHSDNEKRLFHGTTESIVSTINENGFNRVYAGKNGEKFMMKIWDNVSPDTSFTFIAKIKLFKNIDIFFILLNILNTSCFSVIFFILTSANGR